MEDKKTIQKLKQNRYDCIDRDELESQKRREKETEEEEVLEEDNYGKEGYKDNGKKSEKILRRKKGRLERVNVRKKSEPDGGRKLGKGEVLD